VGNFILPFLGNIQLPLTRGSCRYRIPNVS